MTSRDIRPQELTVGPAPTDSAVVIDVEKNGRPIDAPESSEPPRFERSTVRIAPWIDRARTVRALGCEAWLYLAPIVVFAVRVAVLVFLLGFFRFGDLATVREDLVDIGTPRPMLFAALDVSAAVTHAAELMGTRLGSAMTILAVPLVSTLILGFGAFIVRDGDRAVAETLLRTNWRFVSAVVSLLLAIGIVSWSAGLESYLQSTQFWTAAALPMTGHIAARVAQFARSSCSQ